MNIRRTIQILAPHCDDLASSVGYVHVAFVMLVLNNLCIDGVALS